MAQARGYKSRLVMDFETSYNQSPATKAGLILPVNQSQIRSKQNMFDPGTITGRRDPVEPGRGNIDVSGPVTIPMDSNALFYWLKAMFGDPTTTGSGPYNHLFVPGDTQPSLVLEQQFPDVGVYELFNGCKVSKFSLSLGGDGELTATVDIIGGKETIGSAPYDDAAVPVVIKRLGNFQASIKEGGASIATCPTVELNIDFGLDTDSYAIGGGGFRTDLPEGLMQVSGKITAFFRDRTLLDKSIDGTESSLVLSLDSGTDKLEFTLPEIVYERNSPVMEGSKGVRIELPYKAYYSNNVENTCIKVELTNNIAS